MTQKNKSSNTSKTNALKKKESIVLTDDVEKVTKQPISVDMKNNHIDADKKKEEEGIRGKISKKDIKKQLILLAIRIVFLAILCYAVFFVVFGTTRMHDFSMYPSIKDGDLLIYYRTEKSFNAGDVVVVDMDGEEIVARVVAKAGQEVDITTDGKLFVDRQPSAYEAFYETFRAENYNFKYPYRVSHDCYFMLNDYRSNTNDSRVFGEICRDKIKGRIITKIQVRNL